MTIAIVCDVLGAENNGTSIAAYNLIRYLKDKGHEVRVICPDKAKKDEPGFYVLPRRNFGIFNGYLEKNAVVLAKTDKRLLERAFQGVDVIHVLVPFFVGHAAAIYARDHGIPLTASFHCQAENVTSHFFLKNAGFINKAAYRLFYRVLYRYCDCVHYPTQFICDTFEGVVGPLRHEVISNGVSDEFLEAAGAAAKSADNAARDAASGQGTDSPADSGQGTDSPADSGQASGGSADDRVFTVLFTGRYSREKTHKRLIDGVALSAHKDRIRLVFAGTGPLYKSLQRRARRRGILPPVMKFFGRGEMIEAIKSADLYVHPAEIEIEAVACLEAIACGKVPLIADSPRSATRFFAQTPRSLFRYDDPSDLASKMDWWLDHPEEREKWSGAYRSYAAGFERSRCMEKMEEMLASAAASGKGRTLPGGGGRR